MGRARSGKSHFGGKRVSPSFAVACNLRETDLPQISFALICHVCHQFCHDLPQIIKPLVPIERKCFLELLIGRHKDAVNRIRDMGLESGKVAVKNTAQFGIILLDCLVLRRKPRYTSCYSYNLLRWSLSAETALA